MHCVWMLWYVFVPLHTIYSFFVQSLLMLWLQLWFGRLNAFSGLMKNHVHVKFQCFIRVDNLLLVWLLFCIGRPFLPYKLTVLAYTHTHIHTNNNLCDNKTENQRNNDSASTANTTTNNKNDQQQPQQNVSKNSHFLLIVQQHTVHINSQ